MFFAFQNSLYTHFGHRNGHFERSKQPLHGLKKVNSMSRIGPTPNKLPKKAQIRGEVPAGNGEIRANFVAALGLGWTSTASREGLGVTGLNMHCEFMRTLKDFAVRSRTFTGARLPYGVSAIR